MRIIGVPVLVIVVLIIVVVVVGVVSFFAIALRTKNRVMLGVIRRINRAVFNPRQMKTAGTPGAYASIVRHVGRTSSTVYETPIVVRELGDDFVVVLPYAEQADWFKNVMAAGSAEIVTDGATWHVDEPKLVSFDEIVAAMSDKEARSNRMTGASDALRLHRSPVPGPGERRDDAPFRVG